MLQGTATLLILLCSATAPKDELFDVDVTLTNTHSRELVNQPVFLQVFRVFGVGNLLPGAKHGLSGLPAGIHGASHPPQQQGFQKACPFDPGSQQVAELFGQGIGISEIRR